MLVVIAVVVTAIVAPYATGFVSSLQGGASLGAAHAAGMSVAGSVLGGASLGVGVVGGAQITAMGMIAGGAIGGAVGSMVSQGVGVATGIQSKFSWNAVALSALAGGFGAGGAQPQNAWQAAARSIGNNVRTQLIARVTGLQDEFSWASVAAAGVGAGVGHTIGDRFGGALTGSLGSTLARGAVGACARRRSALHDAYAGVLWAGESADRVGMVSGEV